MKAKETKKKTAPEPKKKEENREYLTGMLATLDNRGTAAIVTIFGSGLYGDMDIKGVSSGLETLEDEVEKGDLHRLEGMLAGQVVSLNTMFAVLAIRGHSNMIAGHGEASERYLRMALKAQNQCRATIDTLAQIKNPRQTVITKQANISNGPQQVNNTLNQPGQPESKISENLETAQNKLLSHAEENPYMDTGTARKAGGDDPAMATVDTIHRAKNRAGQSKNIPERR